MPAIMSSGICFRSFSNMIDRWRIY